MIDHVGFSVSDYARAKAFYENALAPLGYRLVMELTAQETGQPAAGFGSGGRIANLDHAAKSGNRIRILLRRGLR